MKIWLNHVFLDWPSTPNEAGVEAGYRALLGWALDDGAKLCDLLDEKGHAAKCNAIAGRLKKQIKQPNRLKQAAALMAVAGLMEPERACDEIISVGGARVFFHFLWLLYVAGTGKGRRISTGAGYHPSVLGRNA